MFERSRYLPYIYASSLGYDTFVLVSATCLTLTAFRASTWMSWCATRETHTSSSSGAQRVTSHCPIVTIQQTDICTAGVHVKCKLMLCGCFCRNSHYYKVELYTRSAAGECVLLTPYDIKQQLLDVMADADGTAVLLNVQL